jgi:rod shape-determining protein MreC
VDNVQRDPERGSFINVVIKPAADLQHLDEVLVITSLDAHLSAQQQADLATSEELKGAEAAAEAERKKAALEMEERLPGLKDPNAPATAPVLGPDGKPVVAPPVAPKPIPAKHPDRFSPGSAVDSPGNGADSGGANEAPDASGESAPKAAAPKAQPKAQPAKPNAPAPKTPQLGRAQ